MQLCDKAVLNLIKGTFIFKAKVTQHELSFCSSLDKSIFGSTIRRKYSYKRIRQKVWDHHRHADAKVSRGFVLCTQEHSAVSPDSGQHRCHCAAPTQHIHGAEGCWRGEDAGEWPWLGRMTFWWKGMQVHWRILRAFRDLSQSVMPGIANAINVHRRINKGKWKRGTQPVCSWSEEFLGAGSDRGISFPKVYFGYWKPLRTILAPAERDGLLLLVRQTRLLKWRLSECREKSCRCLLQNCHMDLESLLLF